MFPDMPLLALTSTGCRAYVKPHHQLEMCVAAGGDVEDTLSCLT
jgi:hypothetical protein